MKMNMTTVCLTCFRSALVSSKGRIKSIAAPVVPIRLASTAPAARKSVLVNGWAGRSPSMRIPPVIVYKLKSKIMNGKYSLSMALESTVPATFQSSPPDAGFAA